MSVLKYIIENCDSGLKYRINFTGSTTLDIDNVWYIECGGIEKGCYRVLPNNDEILDEYEDDFDRKSRNLDPDDYSPEAMFDYIVDWGDGMTVKEVMDEFDWRTLTWELGLA